VCITRNNNTSRKESGPPKRAVRFYFLPDIQPRVSNDTPSFDALTIVAPIVRFNALAIFATPFLSFAIDLNVRTSSFDHARRTTFFFLAILAQLLILRAAFYQKKRI
jgi:hypothetical protein